MKKLCIVAVFFIGMILQALPQDKALFVKIPGWRQPEILNTYLPDNLWDIIDGAADGYLSYDFEEMIMGDYLLAADSNQYITVEVYRHKSPADAFGIFSQERPTKGNYISIGAQGYREDANINFTVGDYYIKIRSSLKSDEAKQASLEIAEKMAALIDPSPKLPQELLLFPKDGLRVYSEQFIRRNFMGYSFLRNVFMAEYDSQGSIFNLFIIPLDSPEACKSLLEAWFKSNSLDMAGLKPGTFEIRDKYNGLIRILWKGSILCGVYNITDTFVSGKYLELLSAKMN